MLLNKRIAIFSSGKGQLTKAIIDGLETSRVSVTCIVTNNPEAGVVQIAKDYNIRLLIVDKEFDIDRQLKLLQIDLIVLAGFLKKVPAKIVNHFKCINIHPSLLPSFGGKGMWGMNVHKAVIESKTMFSGITIHWVDEKYDNGSVIFQSQTPIYTKWTEVDLENAIKKLEYKWYPEIIKQVVYGHRK